MMNNNIGIIILMVIVALIIISIVWGVMNVKHHHNKLREYYDNIKIGDRYRLSIGPLHPFDTATTHNAVIINKTLAGGKYPWVQYRYEDGSVSQSELHDFLEVHTKISK